MSHKCLETRSEPENEFSPHYPPRSSSSSYKSFEIKESWTWWNTVDEMSKTSRGQNTRVFLVLLSRSSFYIYIMRVVILSSYAIMQGTMNFYSRLSQSGLAASSLTPLSSARAVWCWLLDGNQRLSTEKSRRQCTDLTISYCPSASFLLVHLFTFAGVGMFQLVLKWYHKTLVNERNNTRMSTGLYSLSRHTPLSTRVTDNIEISST